MFFLGKELAREIVHPILQAYQLAIDSDNPVAEFLLEYAIMGLLYGDPQPKIDDAIDPMKVQRIPSLRSRDGETKFTEARNALAHIDDRKKTMREVVEKIAALRDEFRGVVKEHLARRLSAP